MRFLVKVNRDEYIATPAYARLRNPDPNHDETGSTMSITLPGFMLIVFLLGGLPAAFHAQAAQRWADHEEDRRALTFRLFQQATSGQGSLATNERALSSARLRDNAFARACLHSLQKAALEKADQLTQRYPLDPDDNAPGNDIILDRIGQYQFLGKTAATVEAALPAPDADEQAGGGVYRFTTNTAALSDDGFVETSGPPRWEVLGVEVVLRNWIDSQCREGAPVS